MRKISGYLDPPHHNSGKANTLLFDNMFIKVDFPTFVWPAMQMLIPAKAALMRVRGRVIALIRFVRRTTVFATDTLVMWCI